MQQVCSRLSHPRATTPGTITVDTTTDTLGDGHCSLQEAILLVNGSPGSDACARVGSTGIDTIYFSIGSGARTISVSGPLTATQPVFIDGTSQPGFNTTTHVALITVTDSSGGILLFQVGSGGSSVRALQLTETSVSSGYDIGTIVSDYLTVQGCYLSTDGSSVVGANAWGVMLDSSNNTIGGLAAGDGNLFGGSGGVRIDEGSGSLVEGNYFGVRADGVTPLSGLPDNQPAIESGFYTTSTSTGSIIRGNIIAGSYSGIELDHLTSSNLIVGNYIGVAADGTSPHGSGVGIAILGSFMNTIGGTTAADRNVISGNGENIQIANQTSGLTTYIPNKNTIEGNYIGTTANGLGRTTALGDISTDRIGIHLVAGDQNQIGGTAAGSGNLISGNATGIAIDTGTTLTTIQGNKIGTDVTGTVAIAQEHGIVLSNASADIGDSITPGNNLISGNTYYSGIDVSGSSGATIYGNRIGLTGDATGSIPNVNGIRLLSGASATIAQNWIGFSTFDGVSIDSTSTVASGSSQNCFTGNTNFGVESLNSGTSAPFGSNFWGSATGPTHSGNPGGTGDASTDHVTYSAFLTTPPAACPGAEVNVTIGGVGRGDYVLPPSGQKRVNYAGLDSGPVVVKSTWGPKVIAAERDSWWDGSRWSDYAQLMGLPTSLVSDTYVFPAYNDVTLDEQLRFGNVDTVDTNVTVTIGGVAHGPYLLHPSEAMRVNYAGVDSGPVVVQGTPGVKIIAAERDSWWDGSTWSSYAQLMGLPASQVSDTYVFPAYNNVTLDEQLRFGNVDTVDTNVTVTIGGVAHGPYLLHPNQAMRVNYAGVDSGPVVVQGTPGVKIIAAERDSWWDGSTWSDYNQLMGLPAA